VEPIPGDQRVLRVTTLLEYDTFGHDSTPLLHEPVLVRLVLNEAAVTLAFTERLERDTACLPYFAADDAALYDTDVNSLMGYSYFRQA